MKLERCSIEGIPVIDTEEKAKACLFVDQGLYTNYCLDVDKLIALYCTVKSPIKSWSTICRLCYELCKIVDKEQGKTFFASVIKGDNVLIVTSNGDSYIIPLEEKVIRDICFGEKS